jgi:beta-glucosidase-like glycosyl hydrolase
VRVQYVGTWGEAATLGLAAGLDQEGGGGPTYPPVQQGIPAALAAGNITMSQVQLAVSRLFTARIRLGMFDPPSTVVYNTLSMANVSSAEHLSLAEAAARQGVTLLRNEVVKAGPALPLSLSTLAGKSVALIGPNANSSYILLGSKSDPSCCTAGIPTIYDELSSRLSSAGVGLVMSAGCVNASCLTQDDFPAAVSVAAKADVVVLALGTSFCSLAVIITYL